jgi:predicted phage terminase large subunit-like protein
MIIMQRLNEKDVSAAALELGYEHLCIPMRWEADRKIAVKTTSIGWKDPRKKDGELMFPERFPEKQVVELETSLGSYAAAGQLQQRPAPRSGGMFERRWFEIVDAAPAGLHCVPSMGSRRNSAESRLRSGLDGRREDGPRSRRLLLHHDVERFRATPANVEKTITNTASQDGKRCRIRIPQDPGQAGKSQAQSLIRKLAGYVVKAVPPTGSKEARATPFSAQGRSRQCQSRRRRHGTSHFFAELEVFPFGGHDDQVDAAADAFNELAEGSSGFLELVQEENAEAAERVAEAAKPKPCDDRCG